MSACNQPPRITQPGHPLWLTTVNASKSWDTSSTPRNALWFRSVNWCLAEH